MLTPTWAGHAVKDGTPWENLGPPLDVKRRRATDFNRGLRQDPDDNLLGPNAEPPPDLLAGEDAA